MTNDPNMTQEELQKNLAILKNSYDMYEKSKKEMVEVRTNKVDKDGNKIYPDETIKQTLELMETMQQDIHDKYIQLGGNEEELKSKKKTVKKESNKKKILEMLQNDSDEKGSSRFVDESIISQELNRKQEVKEFLSENNFNDTLKIDNSTSFDNIPIPSKGQVYKHKMDKIPVAYLTANDENLIASPNLYQDGTIFEYLLKRKIMSSNITPENLLPGDRDAIILWLRASGYGNIFPITINDPDTNEKFDSEIDLSTLKYKKFDLIGDENGYFDYTLPVSGDKVKFKFLTCGDLKELLELEKEETENVKHFKVSELSELLDDILSKDDDIDRPTRIKITNSIKEIKNYLNTFSDKEKSLYLHSITNRLLLNIVSINGVTDRKYINEYVKNMKVRDSSSLRKYIKENEPGVDYSITVEKPESLGGGSIDTFLQFDEFIFLNIKE